MGVEKHAYTQSSKICTEIDAVKYGFLDYPYE